MTDLAFLSLAKRLGNPIAERPDAVVALELFNFIRTFRKASWRERLVPAPIMASPLFSRPRRPRPSA